MVPKQKKGKNKHKLTVICVTGTPGTGKTTISKQLAKELGYKYINLNELLKESNLNIGRDDKRDSYIINEGKIPEKIRETINKAEKSGEKGIILDSHLSHFANKEQIDLCIVCKCELKELKRRLEKRGYSRKKVEENLEAEIFEVCKTEALEQGLKVIEINCSSNVKKEVKEIIKFLKKDMSQMVIQPSSVSRRR